jgi:hypothetical protein
MKMINASLDLLEWACDINWALVQNAVAECSQGYDILRNDPRRQKTDVVFWNLLETGSVDIREVLWACETFGQHDRKEVFAIAKYDIRI